MNRKIALSLLALSAACRAATLYVDPAATGAGTGASWADALPDLQPALELAQPGDVIALAAGTYTPSALTIPGDPRSATFLIPDGVTVVGAPSTLSGEIGTPDLEDNCIHVVTATNAAVTLRRLVITRGFSDHGGLGGGLRVSGGSLDVEACEFTDSSTSSAGGGAALLGTTAMLRSCLFHDNHTLIVAPALYVSASTLSMRECAFDGNINGALTADGSAVFARFCTFTNNKFGGIKSGAITATNGSLTLLDCSFTQNESDGGHGGGALWASGPSLSATGCTFTGNYAGPDHYGQTASKGGAVVSECALSTFSGCTFNNNEAVGGDTQGGHGGAVAITAGVALFSDCSFVGNVVDQPYGFGQPKALGGALYVHPGAAVLIHCTVTNNTDLQVWGRCVATPPRSAFE